MVKPQEEIWKYQFIAMILHSTIFSYFLLALCVAD